MKHRTNWKECLVSDTNLFHFKWQHTSSGINFGNLSKVLTDLQVVNHYEYHTGISNKLNLFLNLMKYCEVINKI